MLTEETELCFPMDDAGAEFLRKARALFEEVMWM